MLGKLIHLAITNRDVVKAGVVFMQALSEARKDGSPGGRNLEPQEREEHTRKFWDVYDHLA